MQHPPAEHVIDGRFVIRRQIGEGRMSTVYLAQDRGAGDVDVAVKILNTSHPDKIKRTLYERETAALKRLAHPSIVRLRHSGWSDEEGVFYLVLDYLPYSLDQFLCSEQQGHSGNIDSYRVIRELGEAIAHAHSENVVHRDIKPSNILFDNSGRAMLTDFGVSKLLDRLTVGETLAHFISGGYASPEQRSADPVDERSDMYSLGAVFYHLLSKQEPPPEGPVPEMIDSSISCPIPLKRMLKAMLARMPADRPSGGIKFLSALETARRLEALPTHFLILTKNAIRDVGASAYGPATHFSDVTQTILEDLGGQELHEIHVDVDQRNPNDVVILGDSFRLICALAEESDALVVKAVQEPYMPRFDTDKGRAMVTRAVWKPVRATFRHEQAPAALEHARTDLADLLSRLNSHQRAVSAKQQQRNSRREFIERWRVVLTKLRRQIGDGPTVRYASLDRDGDRLLFTLDEDPPDGLWDYDTPLAVVQASDPAHTTPVGILVEVRGRAVEVVQDAKVRNNPIPKSGTLATNVIEALAENNRQQHAVDAFLTEQTINPSLATAIIDPATTTRGPVPDLDYFQDWLSPDKKDAVRQALASNELFLIQGPPGTGKTSVIAEIVLQILKREPKATILLSSQSNVAVDHALTRIAEAVDEVPEMVRIGRPEKVGHGGEHWTLAARARAWRHEVLAHCAPVIEQLRHDERRARATAKAASELSGSELQDAGEVSEWIVEAEELVDQVDEYEHELASLGSNASKGTVAAATALVEQARKQVWDHLHVINDSMEKPAALHSMSEREALEEITKTVAPRRRDVQDPGQPAQELRRIQQLRKVLADWSRVAGLGKDFEELVGKSSSVVAATCSISGRLRHGNIAPDIGFDWAIIDEAGRATVPEVLIPIVKSRRVVLVGDERQLPPMVEQGLEGTDEEEGDRLATSLFQALIEQVGDTDPNHLASLRSQYRMHPAIGCLVSNVFYEGRLENGTSARTNRAIYDRMPARVTWLSTSSEPGKAETRRGQSYANVAEADVVSHLLGMFEKHLGKQRRKRVSVGAITGYAGQVEQLNGLIDPGNRDRWKALDIEIATVDSFQGRERDIVVYSTVRSNPRGEIGFLHDHRRVNVALSRARELLMIVGDVVFMENARIGRMANPFARVVEYMKAHEEDCRIISANFARLL